MPTIEELLQTNVSKEWVILACKLLYMLEEKCPGVIHGWDPQYEHAEYPDLEHHCRWVTDAYSKKLYLAGHYDTPERLRDAELERQYDLFKDDELD